MRLLLIEDDALLTEYLVAGLRAQNYAVDVATDGLSGWDYAQAVDYDLILLDINLPGLDGISLCQRLRQQPYKGPILLLTAKSDSADKVLGLDAGADDYIVKPCSIEELCAHIRALLRRHGAVESTVLEWGDLQLNPAACEVTYQQKILPLSAKEYGLLELFLRYPQRVFNSTAILDHLWTFDDAPGEDTVRAHVKRLRQRLKAHGVENMIETLYGMGYRLQSPPKSPTSRGDQARLAIAQRWERTKGAVLERVAVLDRAVAALQVGHLSPELFEQAQVAAHKLAGCLSLFGYPEGTRLGREIEQWLQTQGTTGQATELQVLVQRLQAILQLPPTVEAEKQKSVAAVNQPHLPVSCSQTQVVPDKLRSRSPIPVKVLAVDDDPLVLECLQQLLPEWGIELHTLQNPLQARSMLEEVCPDLLILDVEMPKQSGIGFCQMLRDDPDWNGIPILFFTARQDVETVNQIYAAGADDYISKPCTAHEIITRIFNRLERNQQLRNLSTLDRLTRVANRHQSTDELNRLLSLSQRYQHSFCLAIVILNQLKQIKEQYGQRVGDRCLKQTARILQIELPKECVIARWTEDEFVIGLYGVDRIAMVQLLQQVLQVAQQKAITITDSKTLEITLSAGVSEFPTHGRDLQALYWAADRDLSQVKLAGCSIGVVEP